MSIINKIRQNFIIRFAFTKLHQDPRIKNAAMSYSKKECEEKEDCDKCNEYKPPKPPYKIVVEKSCRPCSFFTWQPKKPRPVILKKPKKCTNAVCKPERKCCPGMEKPEVRTMAQDKTEAKKCWSRLHPERACCKKKKEKKDWKTKSGGGNLYGIQKKKKSNCPPSDWDHCGRYD